MALINDFNNMLKDLKENKNNKTDEFKNKLIDKYNKLYNSSEKLFDKIFYSKDYNENDIKIIKTMLNMKCQKDCGNINKLDADKKIGETLCDIYVKPMLNKKK